MDEGLKRRLVGATVLVSLVVIFVPMLLDDDPVIETGIYKTNIPPMPERDFSSRVIPSDDEKLAIPPVDRRPVIVPLKKPAESVVSTSPTPDSAHESTQSSPAEEAKAEAPAVEPRVGLTAWAIQVGSFSNRENAEKLVAQIREMKYAAFMEQADVDGKTVFRVKVGPEIDRKLADKMLDKLNKDLKPLNLKGSVKSYP
ncbi:MAG: SPOR domain-containing protein [Sedimenticola sp.]|nr:SPOR domain-containing protein [Sedimenticola sp.]